MNRLTFVLLLLAVGLGLLLVNHDSGRTFGIDNEKFGQIVYLLPIAGLLSVGILAGRRGSFASVVRQLAIWLVIILGLVSVYLYRYDLQSFADRLLGGLMPGRAVVVTTAGGEQEIILHKSMSGHFEANVSIEGKTIHMLVDTGARLRGAGQCRCRRHRHRHHETALHRAGDDRERPHGGSARHLVRDRHRPDHAEQHPRPRRAGWPTGPEPARHELPVDARFDADADR